jgi:hypothetical protein
MAVKVFSPGFRIDFIDTIVLIAGAVGAVVASSVEWWMGLIVGFAVGHFFLFCNVFRLARPLELSWAVVFIGFSTCTILTGEPGWPVTIGVTLTTTIVVIAWMMRKPSYHGIAWRRFNPRLPEWWEAQQSGGGKP